MVADGAQDSVFWPGVYRRTLTEGLPPASVYTSLGQALIEATNEKRAPFWLRRALQQPSATTDTHPSLADRLTALGVPPGEELGLLANRASENGAASKLLDDHETALVEALDDEWRSRVEHGWSEEHQRLQTAWARLGELRQLSAEAGLNAEESVEHAILAAELEGLPAAVPLLETAVACAPQNPSANHWLGAALLETGDDRGLAHLERAMQADPRVVFSASERAYEFLLERGQTEEAERYRAGAEEHATAYFSAVEERQAVTPADTFLPHELPPETVERLRLVFYGYRRIRRVLLVRKGLWHFVDSWPLYVVALEPVDPQGSEWQPAAGPSYLDRIAEDISLPSDFHLVIVEPGGNFAERLERVHEALVFAR